MATKLCIFALLLFVPSNQLPVSKPPPTVVLVLRDANEKPRSYFGDDDVIDQREKGECYLDDTTLTPITNNNLKEDDKYACAQHCREDHHCKATVYDGTTCHFYTSYEHSWEKEKVGSVLFLHECGEDVHKAFIHYSPPRFQWSHHGHVTKSQDMYACEVDHASALIQSDQLKQTYNLHHLSWEECIEVCWAHIACQGASFTPKQGSGYSTCVIVHDFTPDQIKVDKTKNSKEKFFDKHCRLQKRYPRPLTECTESKEVKNDEIGDMSHVSFRTCQGNCMMIRACKAVMFDIRTGDCHLFGGKHKLGKVDTTVKSWQKQCTAAHDYTKKESRLLEAHLIKNLAVKKPKEPKSAQPFIITKDQRKQNCEKKDVGFHSAHYATFTNLNKKLCFDLCKISHLCRAAEFDKKNKNECRLFMMSDLLMEEVGIDLFDKFCTSTYDRKENVVHRPGCTLFEYKLDGKKKKEGHTKELQSKPLSFVTEHECEAICVAMSHCQATTHDMTTLHCEIMTQLSEKNGHWQAHYATYDKHCIFIDNEHGEWEHYADESSLKRYSQWGEAEAHAAPWLRTKFDINYESDY